MKRIIIASCLLTLTFSLHAISWPGYWEGILQPGGQPLKVGFQFSQTGQTLKATMDVPQQSLFNFAATKIQINQDSCYVFFDGFHASYQGSMKNDSIVGIWEQNGVRLPLVLHRAEKPIAVKRPQTPLPPYPYWTEELVFTSTDGRMQYGATLTRPTKMGRYPALVFITGSGQQDRDETIAGHKPFLVIADYLTRKGYAVLRIDDRGIGKTTGNFSAATTYDFAQDVEQAILFLKKREDIDPDKIGLLGHSEGGLIGPMVASRNANVAFLILLAGPGIASKDLLQEQNSALLQVQGIKKSVADNYGSLMRSVMEIYKNQPDSLQAIRAAMRKYRDWKYKVGTKTVETVFGTTDTSVIGKILRNEFSKETKPWMHAFISIDPGIYLRKVYCPVLALNGSLDAQVLPYSNTRAISLALQKGKNKNFTVKILPGLNHLFQHCGDFSHSTSYGLIDETFAPEALDQIGSWLGSNFPAPKL